ncbi:MAG TPA: NAD(P)H-dependent oxidoreductase subunit E [Candidatus Deferrimicrobium sp.]|nr:NAD(P)H-dependent oxidoreductase subunit E [Candidatus Deferrimicrobium sp.]
MEQRIVKELNTSGEEHRVFEPDLPTHPKESCNCSSPQEQEHLYRELDEFIAGISNQEGILIRVLHHAQNLFGYLPRQVQIHIANSLGKSLAEVYGVVSFYHYFTIDPKAKHTMEVCMGTACYVKGAGSIIAELEKELGIKVGEISKDQKYGITVSRCIGACGLAPVMVADKDIHGRLKPEMIPDILKGYTEPDGGI